jgi:type IV pilus assembly protein PilY1
MKRPWLMKMIFSLMVLSGIILLPGTSKAAGDTYSGDTEIYGSATATYKPNVLFIVDDSGSMKSPPPNAPADYVPGTTYGAETVCTASLDIGSHNRAFASLSDILNGTGGSLLIPPDLASVKSGSGGSHSATSARVTLTPGGNPIFDSPQVMASLTSGSGGARPVSSLKSGQGEEIGSALTAVNAIWNGSAPEFLRVSSSTISGTVTLSTGGALSGVDITFQRSGGTAHIDTTSGTGFYSFSLTDTRTYNISIPGYTVSPSSWTVSANATVNITATRVYSISGQTETSGGNNLRNVDITVTDGSGNVVATTTSDNNGDYSIADLIAGTYTVTASKTSYSFNPQTVTLGPNQSGLNFRAVSLFHISGQIVISGGGGGLSGVTVTATNTSTGQTYTATSTGSGGYQINNTPNGSYTLTTSAVTGYTISPSSLSVTLSGQSDSGNDFTATSSGGGGGGGGTTYQISGNITNSNGNNDLSGITVTVTLSNGTVVGTATTNNRGNYTISGLTGGGITYTVTPTDPNNTYTFSAKTTTINSSNKTVDFNANRTGGGGGGGGSTVNCSSTTIYKHTASGGGSDTYSTWGNLSNGIQTNCNAAYLALTTTGIWVGNLNSNNGTCTSSDQAGTFFLGNWLNWANQPTSNATGTSKMDIAKQVVTNLIQTNTSLRMGMITFDKNNKGGEFITLANGYTSYVADQDALAPDGRTNRLNLIDAVASLYAHTFTPLGGSLYEAMVYYMGKNSWVQPSIKYTSPIQAACQTNYVIIVTDGMSTSDNAMVTGAYPNANGEFGAYCLNGDCDGDGASNGHEMLILGMDPGSGSDYLDDVAWYMHHHDMISSMSGSKVTTYTVGFALDPADMNDLMGIQLLTDTAANGGGKFVNVKDSASLTSTLSSILGSILQINTSFVAPVVPVSPENKTYAGNSVYLGFFLPQSDGFWYGNLKKYGLVNKQLVDVTGKPATATTGAFNATAKSVWSPVQDGGLVKEGGVGAVLLAQGTGNRHLYTYLGATATITTTANAFTTGNANLTPAHLGFNTGVAATDASNFTQAVNYASGYDTNGANNRPWLMGDILHSEPAVVNYASNLSVIYVGGNDGMLHAFVDANPMNCGTPINTGCSPNSVPSLPTLPSGVTDGGEMWGFIPPDVLPNLQNLYSSVHGYGVDGSPATYYYDSNNDGVIGTTSNDCNPAGSANCDQVILVFGERRGGSSYWALNVTDPLNPVYLWHIDNTTVNFTELGESYSKPKIASVNIGGTTTQVVFIGGGYDNATEDVLSNFTTDTRGRGIYAINLQTGALVARWDVNNYTGGDQPLYSIPSDVTFLDTDNDGRINIVYVGDVHGQIWKYDVSSSTPANWTAKIIFKSNTGGDSSTGRKFFYPPDVGLGLGYQALYVGTGDREHPKSSISVVDRIYKMYDKPSYTGIVREGGSTTPTSSNATPLLMDVTSNLTPSGLDAGWYIRLDTAVTGHLAGEKVLSAPLLLNKDVTYTTYAPLLYTSVPDSCTPVLGTGFVWSLNYADGGAFFDYNNDGTTGLTDRYKSVGSGIPSGLVVAIGVDGAVGFVSASGGLPNVPVPPGSGTKQIYWHQPY